MNVTTQVSQAVEHPVRYALAADHRFRDDAMGVAETLLDTVADAITNHPRSLQKTIGPSEIGNPCSRALLHKLNGDPEPPRPDIPWKPTIGTAVHAWLDEVFTKASAAGGREEGRWLTEERLEVGQLNGEPIEGSCDLYDSWSGVVSDWKIVGSSTRKKYRAHGPSQTYRVQAHLYGKGYDDEGYKVRMVMIAFLPRDGELTDSFIWSEPYDRSIAETALARLNSLETLRTQLGVDQALNLYSPCEDRWCDWCGTGTSFPKMQTLPEVPAQPQIPATAPVAAATHK